ncbi:MAG: hypothetical protein AAGH68_02075 [Pseudomonadota bacterium]
MTDQKKPETISDADLDGAQGGFGSWGEPTSTLKNGPKNGDGFGSWGTTGSTLKRTVTNMEVVNEDE